MKIKFKNRKKIQIIFTKLKNLEKKINFFLKKLKWIKILKAWRFQHKECQNPS